MAASPFYARIRADVLAIARAVPAGHAVTFSDIGRHLDVMPRHVAYILKMLPDPAAHGIDPARVIASDTPHPAIVAVASLDHGVPQQTRPANAPVGRPARRRR
ncbi:MAG: MGMT family protein [Sandarakinorhabdus sp.]|jgi:hypothetical protein|nr:MGMT family protein [Sandarakinorhabdus sp.]